MTIYIAAPYPYRDEAIQVMTALEQNGHTVTSRWLKIEDELSDEDARKDLEDIRNADVLLALNPGEWAHKGTGGRHVELGYAHALNKRIILAGERSNIFHYLKTVEVIELGDAIHL